ncbi:hypothetical protein ACW73L_16050 [Methylolobus aquaticus]
MPSTIALSLLTMMGRFPSSKPGTGGTLKSFREGGIDPVWALARGIHTKATKMAVNWRKALIFRGCRI